MELLNFLKIFLGYFKCGHTNVSENKDCCLCNLSGSGGSRCGTGGGKREGSSAGGGVALSPRWLGKPGDPSLQPVPVCSVTRPCA